MCNHPELFERREAKSPYFFNPEPYVLPKFLFRHGLLHSAFPSRHHLLTGRFSIWAPEHIHNSLFHGESQVTDETHTISNTFASFSRLMGLSPGDLYHIMNNGQLTRYLYILCIFFSISPVSEIYLRNWKILFLSSLKYGCEVLALERNLHHNTNYLTRHWRQAIFSLQWFLLLQLGQAMLIWTMNCKACRKQLSIEFYAAVKRKRLMPPSSFSKVTLQKFSLPYGLISQNFLFNLWLRYNLFLYLLNSKLM